jgi:ABC-type transport system substrate-binding protein
MGFSTSARSRLAAGLAVASLVVAACGSSTATPTAAPATTGPTTAPVTAAPVATPIVGDVLTVAELSTPDGLDPVKIQGNADFTALAYDSLLYLTSDGVVKPMLAESWKMSNGNKQMDITLRAGVKFSDGTALDAAAVKASLDYARDAGGAQASYLAGSTIEATGALTVTIKLTDPDPILPYMLTQNWGIGSVICPAALKDPKTIDAQHASCGAGPYVFDPAQTVAGDTYTYTANPTYYDATRQHFKKIVIKVMADEQAAVNGATTGQIDMYKGSYSGVEAAKTAGLQVVGVPTIAVGLLLLDRNGTIAKPLADVKVRQAIEYAIDREAVTTALKTGGGPAYETVPEGADGYSTKDAKLYAYNIDKAKELLAAAGYANGFEMEVLAPTFAGFGTMAEAIQGQLAKVGITLKLVPVTDGPAWIGGIMSKKTPASGGPVQANPMYIQAREWLPNSMPFNPFNCSDEQLNTLYAQAAAADDAARAAIDVQIEEYILENALWVPVSWTPIEFFGVAKIGGLAVSAGNPTPNISDLYLTK